MNSNRSLLTLALSAALVMSSAAADAAVFCVADTTQLRNAVETVSGASGAGSNEIRVQTGTYNIATGAGGNYALAITLNTTPLSITGGWNAACTQRNQIADATILSGNNTVRLMSILALADSSAELLIEGISFRNGLTASGSLPSCLNIETDVNAGALLNLDRNTFRNCRGSSGTGPALSVRHRSGEVRIRSSVFTDNAGASGTVGISNLGSGPIYFTGNTVAYNDDAGSLGGPAGIQASSLQSGAVWLVNNIVTNNGVANSSDLFITSNSAVFSNSNVFGVLAGDLANLTQNNNLTGAAGFQSPTDLRLRSDSIARNSGALSVIGGNTVLDVFGLPRQQGGRVDRGAHEFDELLVNGFE